MKRSLLLVPGLALLACVPRSQPPPGRLQEARAAAERDLARARAELDSLRRQRQAIEQRIELLAQRPLPRTDTIAVATELSMPASASTPRADSAGATAASPVPGGGERGLSEAETALLAERVYFDFDRATLAPAARRLLQEKAALLRENPTLSLALTGHADVRGPEEYNQRLSERRAAAVRRFLTAQGVDPQRLSTSGRGETAPAAEGSTEDAHRLNRRVEFVVQ